MRLHTALALLATGCAAPAYVGNTGRVTPKGDFRVALGTSYQVNSSSAEVIRLGRDLARSLRSKKVACPDTTLAPECWAAADVRPVVEAAYRFAVVAPVSTNAQVSGRWGFAPGLDAGLRYGPGNMGVDLGWQLFGPRDPAQEGWGGTLLAGYGTRDLGSLGDAIEGVLQGEAGLTDYQLTFVAGRQFGEVGHLYLGGRYLLTRWKIQVLPDIPLVFDGGAQQRALLGTDASGSVHQLGGVLGAAIGYRNVFVGAELDFLQAFGDAQVLFERVRLDGFGVMPAVYVYAQF